MVMQCALPIYRDGPTKRRPIHPKGRWQCQYPGCTNSGEGYTSKKSCGPTHRSALWRHRKGVQEIKPRVMQSPCEVARAKAIKERIETMSTLLTDRDRAVLTLLFGLDDGHCRSMSATARELGISRERVRQIKARALHKLDQPKGTTIRRGRPRKHVEMRRIEATRRALPKSA